MNVVADRVNRLCGFLGRSDDDTEQNAEIADAASRILGRAVAAAEIAAVRSGSGDPHRELLCAIAVHFDMDPRYLLDPEAEEMRVLDQKLGILETARTLGIKLGAVHFRGGNLNTDTVELLIETIRAARATAPGGSHGKP
ncbi:hypothetical protein [Nocardia crassostreae]|uniref:hypothetical protein n=1 Tax=Nocardia crassostreae TaxID=53428 RepID=UPI0008324747|nr:hypothetical protein [Nocardia crassostreae]